MSIRDILKQIIHDEFVEMYGVPCTVKSVDEDAKTCVCSPVNGDADFIDVRLQAHSGNGVLIFPTVGSNVIVQPINTATGYLSMFSQVDSIQLLDGSFGGLIKISDLVGQLNSIENKVNDVISALKTHTHTGVSTGGGTSGPSTAFTSITDLSGTTVEDIENDKITHGDI